MAGPNRTKKLILDTAETLNFCFEKEWRKEQAENRKLIDEVLEESEKNEELTQRNKTLDERNKDLEDRNKRLEEKNRELEEKLRKAKEDERKDRLANWKNKALESRVEWLFERNKDCEEEVKREKEKSVLLTHRKRNREESLNNQIRKLKKERKNRILALKQKCDQWSREAEKEEEEETEIPSIDLTEMSD